MEAEAATAQKFTKSGAKWVWTAAKERAALLVAQDEWNDEKIAADAGISRRWLAIWKQHPEFAERVETHLIAIRAAIRRNGIAIVENRVKRLQTDWRRMQQIITERAESEEMQRVPGGTTGLLVKQIKGIGKGEDFQIVEQYAVDTGLLAELRAHELQAAKELGQWEEVSKVTVREKPDLSQLSDEELIDLERGIARKVAAGT